MSLWLIFFTKQYSSLLRPHHLPYFTHSYSLRILLALTLSSPSLSPPSPRHRCCSVAKSCPAPCDPTDCSTPGFPVLHHLSELAQTHVYWVGDAILLSHPLSSLLLPSIFPSLRVFSNELAFHIRWPNYWCIGTSASVAVLPMNIQGWFPLGLTGLISLQSKGLSRVFSSTSFFLSFFEWVGRAKFFYCCHSLGPEAC